MKLKFCHCRNCKAGRRSHHAEITRIKRSYRRRVHRMLKAGIYDERLPIVIPIGYTD